MSIPLTPLEDNEVFTFFNQNILFNTLQVRKSNGTFGKVKKYSILNHPERYIGIQINSIDYLNTLAFDCDHEDVLSFMDFNLPLPSLTIINNENGRHHHLYYLINPIPLFNTNKKTNSFLCDIYNGISKKLGSDKSYTGIISKNFINKNQFRILGSLKKYSLNDFSEFTKSHISKSEYKIEVQEPVFSRHIKLFDSIRYYAYSIAGESESYDDLFNAIFLYAKTVNKNLENPIKIKYIVKNVSNFCWENKYKFNKNKWNWSGYKKQTDEVNFVNRSKREKDRRKKELIEKCPINLNNIK